MENKEVIPKPKEVRGMEMYKKTPAERIELKKVKKEHKEWLNKQPKK
jgi:hypothetical protein